MVVCATADFPNVAEDAICAYYTKADFITVDHLREGRACTCMLVEDKLDIEGPLLIAGCDNGMDIDREAFDKLTGKCDRINGSSMLIRLQSIC